jgi:chromosomal replication initiation ATPase DnaA
MTKDVIIPSKDEASALAVANLMVINFSGQMTLENILEKDLLQISIAKAKSHEMVQNKLRDQINETLFGKSLYVSKPNFESDLAKNKVEDRSFDKTCTKQPYQNCDRVNFQSENFNDTFEHFSIDSSNSTSIEAFDGSSYSYL